MNIIKLLLIALYSIVSVSIQAKTRSGRIASAKTAKRAASERMDVLNDVEEKKYMHEIDQMCMEGWKDGDESYEIEGLGCYLQGTEANNTCYVYYKTIVSPFYEETKGESFTGDISGPSFIYNTSCSIKVKDKRDLILANKDLNREYFCPKLTECNFENVKKIKSLLKSKLNLD